MHGRIKSVTNELTVVVTSDDLGYTKHGAIADANEYFAENYPGETWERVGVELDKYNAWSVRYQRHTPNPNDKRPAGPNWDQALPARLSSVQRHEDAESNVV